MMISLANYLLSTLDYPVVDYLSVKFNLENSMSPETVLRIHVAKRASSFCCFQIYFQGYKMSCLLNLILV